MKKKILIPVGMAALFLYASWQAAETTVSPDRLFLADNGKSFVCNKQGRVVNSSRCRPTGRKWKESLFLVSCQCHDAGCEWKTLGGMRRKLRYDVRIGRQETFGNLKQKWSYSLRDILYNPLSKSLWVTQRFNNELLGD